MGLERGALPTPEACPETGRPRSPDGHAPGSPGTCLPPHLGGGLRGRASARVWRVQQEVDQRPALSAPGHVRVWGTAEVDEREVDKGSAPDFRGDRQPVQCEVHKHGLHENTSFRGRSSICPRTIRESQALLTPQLANARKPGWRTLAVGCGYRPSALLSGHPSPWPTSLLPAAHTGAPTNPQYHPTALVSAQMQAEVWLPPREARGPNFLSSAQLAAGAPGPTPAGATLGRDPEGPPGIPAVPAVPTARQSPCFCYLLGGHICRWLCFFQCHFHGDTF